MRVEVRNGNVDKALRILRKKQFDDGMIRDVMERRFYEKPSQKRRRRKQEAVNRQKKAIAKEKAKWEAARRGRR